MALSLHSISRGEIFSVYMLQSKTQKSPEFQDKTSKHDLHCTEVLYGRHSFSGSGGGGGGGKETILSYSSLGCKVGRSSFEVAVISLESLARLLFGVSHFLHGAGTSASTIFITSRRRSIIEYVGVCFLDQIQLNAVPQTRMHG